MCVGKAGEGLDIANRGQLVDKIELASDTLICWSADVDLNEKLPHESCKGLCRTEG